MRHNAFTLSWLLWISLPTPHLSGVHSDYLTFLSPLRKRARCSLVSVDWRGERGGMCRRSLLLSALPQSPLAARRAR